MTSSMVVGSSAIKSSGYTSKSHGDAHALAHPARELMGVRAQPLLPRNADLCQDLEHAATRRLTAQPEV